MLQRRPTCTRRKWRQCVWAARFADQSGVGRSVDCEICRAAWFSAAGLVHCIGIVTRPMPNPRRAGSTPWNHACHDVSTPPDRQLIRAAVTQLPAAHRAVIRLSYYLGWTTAQIAAELETTESIVRSRLHYALRMLQLTLDELETSQRRALPPLTGSAVMTHRSAIVSK